MVLEDKNCLYHLVTRSLISKAFMSFLMFPEFKEKYFVVLVYIIKSVE